MGLVELLRQLDEPEWLEQPRVYDNKNLEIIFTRLSSRLNRDFQTQCGVEQGIQDSSQYGRIEVPAEATVAGMRIIVSVSKFGQLAVVSADNPGAFLGTADAEAEGELNAGDLAKIEQALEEIGYTTVPEELLMRPYDGSSRLVWYGSHLQPSWWDRFFGSF